MLTWTNNRTNDSEFSVDTSIYFSLSHRLVTNSYDNEIAWNYG